MPRIVFHPEAETELLRSIDWYEERGKGLGAEFLRAVEAAVASIDRNPQQYQRVHGLARRVVLRKFPYSLIYLESASQIVVLACFHASRDPQRWHIRNK